MHESQKRYKMDDLLDRANQILREKGAAYDASKRATNAEIAKRGVDYRNPEIRPGTDDDKLFEMAAYLRSKEEGMKIQVPELLRKASKKGVSNMLLRRVLATDNELWELFFHRDFPGYDASFGDEITTDSRGNQTRRMTSPPEWVGGVKGYGPRDEYGILPEYSGTDPEYDRVPWRRFYMWCVFFERTAMRMVALDTRHSAILYAGWPQKKRQEFRRAIRTVNLGGASETDDGVVSIMSEPKLDGFDKHPNSMYYARARLDGSDIYILRLSGAVSYVPPGGSIFNERSNNLLDVAKSWAPRTSKESIEHFKKLIPSNIPYIGGFEPEQMIRMAIAWAFVQSGESATRFIDKELLSKLRALSNDMKRLPSVPIARGSVAFGDETVQDDVLYVGDQCCANERCSNKPVGVSVIDGLHYCSKECQPIARVSQ